MKKQNTRIHTSSDIDTLTCLGNNTRTKNCFDLAGPVVLLKVQNLHPRTDVHTRKPAHLMAVTGVKNTVIVLGLPF